MEEDEEMYLLFGWVEYEDVGESNGMVNAQGVEYMLAQIPYLACYGQEGEDSVLCNCVISTHEPIGSLGYRPVHPWRCQPLGEPLQR